MTHVNQRTIGPWHWKRGSKSRTDVAAENPVGSISAVSSCPFVYKIVESNATPKGGGLFEIMLTVEPASPEEAGAFLKWDWSKNADREDQARWTASELRQKSWYSGIPADAKIFCEAHQKLMRAHGANHYDNRLVCDQCVEQIEGAIARNEITDPQVWITQRAEVFTLVNKVDDIEARGEGVIQLGKKRYLEIITLYSFIRYSQYKADAHIEEHYPYKDMVPSMYRGYLRENWEPGEYVNSPQEIVFTNRNKLLSFLESGGKIPEKN